METRILTTEQEPAPDDLEGELRRLRGMVEASEVPEARVYVKDLVERWPDDSRVQHWDRVLAPPKVTVGTSRLKRNLTPDLDWLRAHAHEYPGNWLAVHGGRLVVKHPERGEFKRKLAEHPEWEHPVVVFQPGRSE